MTHATRALQSHDLTGDGLKLWITYIGLLFCPHKDMEALKGWVISPMPGQPPIQHKHERQYTRSTHSVIPTRWIWDDDYDGQMIFGDLVGLKFPDICLTGEEKPRKNLTQETCPDRGSNPGPAAWQARMLPLAPQRWTQKIMWNGKLKYWVTSPKSWLLEISLLISDKITWQPCIDVELPSAAPKLHIKSPFHFCNN